MIDNEPVDVCFKEYRLPSRLGDHGDAVVMFLERISGGINAFLTKCRSRWLLGGDAPVYERKHGKADDSVRTSCYFVVIQSQDLPFARLVMVLGPVSRRPCLEGWTNSRG